MDDLIKILQASVAPTVLISGAGLILLTMTNRLARTIDRIRLLTNEHKSAPHPEAAKLLQQIKILYKRCQLLQIAVVLTMGSIICVSTVILMLFSSLAFNLNFLIMIKIVFALGLVSLISALVYFLCDIKLSLHSVTIEIQHLI